MSQNVSAELEHAKRALEHRLREDPTGFEDVAERLHRIEGLVLEGETLRFSLERHPADWTSVQTFEFCLDTGNLSEAGEEAVELFVSSTVLIERDLDSFFNSGWLYEFEDCASLDEIEERARALAQGALPNLVEGWSGYPGPVEVAQDKIRAQWDAAAEGAAANYVDRFVDRAVEEWTRRASAG